MRPFLLYHLSPVSRRKAILKDGLCPRKVSVNGDWRAPYICFCKFPNTAWALSATHSGKKGNWDLWCVWSDVAIPYETRNSAHNPRVTWWFTEYRCFHRIPKSKIWHVGTRRFIPRKRVCKK